MVFLIFSMLHFSDLKTLRADALKILQHPYRMYILYLTQTADVIRSFANKSLQDLIFMN